jgi:hypothetical protein
MHQVDARMLPVANQGVSIGLPVEVRRICVGREGQETEKLQPRTLNPER